MHSECIFNDVTGVILAGGKSKRMGRDKARLEVSGISLFDRNLQMMQELVPRILIAGDRPDLSLPDVPCHADLYPGSALGGLYTGLLKASDNYIFVSACDMPFPDSQVAKVLLKYRHKFDVVVPQTENNLEPLFAVYRRTCLSFMKDMLDRKEYRIYDFYPHVSTRYVQTDELPNFWEFALMNINTPKEYQMIKEKG